MKPIYLDYNATTPIDPRVAEAMLPFVREHFGNPSSSHVYGITAKSAVDKARFQVAQMLHCDEDEVVFTSGGSESNNLAIKGVAWAYRQKNSHIITSSVEHPAVLEVCRYLQAQGYRITHLPVDGFGVVDLQKLQRAITPQTVLITIMHSNNEVGTVEPIEEVTAIARERGILVHTDAAQSVGKIPVRVDDLNVDLLSIAGHKLYAPKGIGALYVRRGVTLEKLIHGANHEMNRRAGTENTLEIVGLGEACALVTQYLTEYQKHMLEMRDRLESGLKKELAEIRINGHPEKRLPNTLSVSFRGLQANRILSELKNVAASPGAACHSDRVSLSHVLEAMQTPMEYAMGTIRFSVGRLTTSAEIDQVIVEVSQVVGTLRST